MIKCNVSNVAIEITETETLTAGRVGLECQFTFSSEWNGLAITAYFLGETTNAVVVSGNTVVVPAASMVAPGYKLYVGVVGRDAQGNIVIPTLWASAGKIKTSPGEEEEPTPSPDVVAQIQLMAINAVNTANAAMQVITDHYEEIEEVGAEQVAAVNAAGTTQTGNVNTTGATQVAAVQAKGEEVLDSIPEDYTTLSNDVSDLKSSLTNVDKDLYGEQVRDFSTIYSNDNTAVSNNNDGTYNVGTNDYGTTVFGQQMTLAPGRYYMNGTPTGVMCVATSTNAADAVFRAETSPTEFELTEELQCYLLFRMNAKATAACVIEPYIKYYGIEKTVDDLDTDVDSIYKTVNKTSEFVSGFYINTNVNVGSSITFSAVKNNGVAYNVQPCKTGDYFKITGYGGENSRLWAFVDSNFKLVEKSVANAIESGVVHKAPADGFLIANSYTNATTSLYKITANAEEGYTRITNPHQLFWKMGAFSQTGPQTGTFTDRMYMTCKVKAGSTISAPNTGGVNISFGYKLDETSTNLDYYQSFNYGYVGVQQDCIIYVGVLYNTPAYLPNDSLLDNLTFDLLVVDYDSKYKKDRVFGSPLTVHYEGQHTDETGWTLTTDDPDDIIAAFDALVTAGNGLLTKTDLGTAYSTYHMYQYDTVPVGLHVGAAIDVPKIAIICGQHGNEKMSTYAMHYLLHDMIHKPSKNPILYYLRSNCIISFIPIANPYGWINRTRLNENGVNLNRNWPTYNWSDYSDETSGPGGINYKGTAAGSEEQTKLMIKFLRANYDAIFAIDLHTNGEDTSAWYEISTAVLNAGSNTSDPDYEVQSSYLTPSRLNISYIKSWMDENYGSDLGNVFYGNVTFPESDRPTAGNWIRESNNMVGITFEVLAGSSESYLGSNLGKYSPASIKAAAEILGDYLVAMIENCKNQS